MQSTNPLSSHFRQPAVFLQLPSKGQHWAPDSLEMPANGEIGVMPMTARDEILLRTPDALMNGQGVVSVIESCCPAIKNAWATPSVDVDAILIAIRIATYGDEMDMDTNCPACKGENRHALGLGEILLRLKSPDYSKTVMIDGLQIKLRPISYFNQNKNSMINFEQQRLIDLISNDDLPSETKTAQFDMHLKKIIDLNISTLVASTEFIMTENNDIVTDKNYITEFYNNTSNSIIKAVQTKLEEYTKDMSIPPARVQCDACEHQYNVEVSFDYANFFVPLS